MSLNELIQTILAKSDFVLDNYQLEKLSGRLEKR